MDFQTVIDRAMEIRRLYEEQERQLYGSPGPAKKLHWDLWAMWAIWQNLSLRNKADAISKIAEKNWSMNCLIVCGH